MWWVTLDDRGYRLSEYDKEPDNAIAGPYATQARAYIKMDYFAKDGRRAANVLAWLMAGFVSVGFVALGWAMRGML